MDITKNPDLTQQQVEKILDETSTQNLLNYESICKHFEPNAGINIKKSVPPKNNYDSKHLTNIVLKTGDKVMRINQMNKNCKGGRLDKYMDQNIYIVQKTLTNGNIQILDIHSNKNTSIPPITFTKKYTTPQSTTFPELPSTTTHIPTNQSSTLLAHVPISIPSQKSDSSPQSKYHTLLNEPMKPCLKTNIHT